ncbi:MAG: cation:proton antiporter [Synechococcus sp.]
MSPVLASWLWILLGGLLAGQVARRLGAPALLGAIAAGLLMAWGRAIAPEVLGQANDLRTIAVTIVLMRAGLGLDRNKLVRQGTVALRLGILPGACEAIAIAILARFILGFDWTTGLLLGTIIGAESPAVIVPGMLRLKSSGWGVAKGIPDAMLTGSALSDALLLLVFSLLLGNAEGNAEGSLFGSAALLPLQVIVQVGLGAALGYGLAYALVWVLARQAWTQNAVQDVLVAAGAALFLVLGAQQWPYFSGYLAAMAMGFFVIEFDPPLARRLRNGFNVLWIVAEIVLFVLLGATVNPIALVDLILPGLLLLSLSLLLGRSLGWYLSTVGSNWTLREKLFLLPGNSAKATVQAAIGAVPLAAGIEGGQTILAIAVLSILITAPLGAWAIPFFAPKLLDKGEVDPTKVVVSTQTRTLAAVDTSVLSENVLTKAADVARRTDGEVVVLHVRARQDPVGVSNLRARAQELLADIRYRFEEMDGSIPATIVRVASDIDATDIVMGKRGHRTHLLLGSVSEAVLATSQIPVSLVERSVD